MSDIVYALAESDLAEAGLSCCGFFSTDSRPLDGDPTVAVGPLYAYVELGIVGTGIVIPPGPAGILLEDGTRLLLEDGTSVLLMEED